ncbi:MAG: dipeptidase B [Clostridiales bacterium]|nr:dipeptidase B [Clostridiales bacterium]
MVYYSLITSERTVATMKYFKIILSLTLAAMLCLTSVSALACTAIYVGADLTEDGSTMFARSEDIANSYNKVFYVAPAGQHKAGEVYQGCYGFTYTFTKDSYSYTAFSDDNLSGFCPDCGGEHPHTPYQAGGTNEMGLTVTATETLSGASKAIKAVDPFNKKTGIEEAEIPTVLLSECATAKEAVDLLLNIYDTVGCQGGSGIFIADNTETWYIENTTGTQYIALKLSESMAFAVPNQSAIGLIDLDDENVIASDKLIATAKEAGTFVGDEAANTIDYIASYLPDQAANGRYASALKFFNAAFTKAQGEIVPADYAISNVDAQGNIVPLYTNIAPDHPFTIKDMIAYYDIPGIGGANNLEIHIFQTFAQDGVTDTVEWVAMDNGCYNVFVPYYPMLTTDTYAAYQLGTAEAAFVEEKPAEGLCYPATSYKPNENMEWVQVEGFKVLPANWADSYYWTFDALSNLADFAGLTEDQLAAIDAELAALQQKAFDAYAALQAAAANPATGTDLTETCTDISMNCAKEVHAAVVQLVNGLK